VSGADFDLGPLSAGPAAAFFIKSILIGVHLRSSVVKFSFNTQTATGASKSARISTADERR
jgi:hypothetical protein